MLLIVMAKFFASILPQSFCVAGGRESDVESQESEVGAWVGGVGGADGERSEQCLGEARLWLAPHRRCRRYRLCGVTMI